MDNLNLNVDYGVTRINPINDNYRIQKQRFNEKIRTSNGFEIGEPVNPDDSTVSQAVIETESNSDDIEHEDYELENKTDVKSMQNQSPLLESLQKENEKLLKENCSMRNRIIQLTLKLRSKDDYIADLRRKFTTITMDYSGISSNLTNLVKFPTKS